MDSPHENGDYDDTISERMKKLKEDIQQFCTRIDKAKGLQFGATNRWLFYDVFQEKSGNEMEENELHMVWNYLNDKFYLIPDAVIR